MDVSGETALATRQGAGISGFWRRFLAFVIDSVILGLPAFVCGFFLFDVFAQLGPWGRLVGFLISLAYFGLLNSALAGGQTPGKRAVAIRVVNQNDQPVGAARSFLRAAIVSIPYFSNGILVDPKMINSWVGIVFSLLVFGLGLSLAYLMVFNRRNRRGLHDLIAGTYVVKTDRDTNIPKPSTWRGHLVFVGVLLLGSITLPIVLQPLANTEPFQELLATQGALLRDPDLWSAGITIGTNYTWNSSGSGSANFCNATVQSRTRPADFDRLADRVAQTVLQTFARAQQADRVLINVVYGYDLGIAKGFRSQLYNRSPGEWRERIGQAQQSSL